MVILVGALMPHSPTLSAADRTAAPPEHPQEPSGPPRPYCRPPVLAGRSSPTGYRPGPTPPPVSSRPDPPRRAPARPPAGKGALRLVCRCDVSVRPEVNELGALLTDDRPLPTPRRTTLAHDFHSTNTGRPLSARSNRARPDPTDPDVHVLILFTSAVGLSACGSTERLELTSGPLEL